MIKNNQYKKLIIRFMTIISLSSISLSGFAQIFNAEQNPLSVKWRQINTSGFQLIYPSEMERDAQRMANTIPHIYPHIGGSLGRQKTSIPILLQNRGVVANGFVQLGPKKSEFYSTPPQQFDSQDWLNNLAVHELRHVAQFDKLSAGRLHPFPEQVYLAWFGVSIPTWFFEGDAVTTETALTNAGRGRQPAWIMPYRTSLLEGKKLSYSKAYFGSDKDIAPGYYQLGYLIATNIRKQYGKEIFDQVLGDIQKRPFRLYPFSNSLKKFTGKGSHQWFRETQDSIYKNWSTQAQAVNSQDYKALNKPSKIETNYHLPVQLEDGRILTLKQSKSETAHFITIDKNGKEQNLLHIAYQEQPWFSYAKGMLVWDEVRYDPRFRQRSYSTVCSYELSTGKITKLSSRSRLFSPSLSKDAKKIVAVSIDLSNQCKLVELDAKNGAILRTFSNPDNLILQTPSYDDSGELMAFIGVSEKGKSLWTIDQNGKTEQLITETQQQLSRPIFLKQQIAFNAHYSGVDNIYSIDISSKKISALSAAKYGAFNASPTIAGDSILFSSFSKTGYQVTAIPLREESIGSNHFVYFGAAAEKQENTGNVFDNIPDNTFSSKPYRALGNLFNFHSIIPTIADEHQVGLQLSSDNLLNTLSFFGAADYHSDLKRFEYSAGFTLRSFYPVLSATYRNRPRRTFYSAGKTVQQGDWRENTMKVQLSLPLNVNVRNDNYGLSARVATSYTQRYMAENMPKNFITSLKFPMEYGITLNHNVRQANRDIAPKWGQILRLTYANQPFDKQLAGELFAAETFFYFPGFARNHSFLANYSYQVSNGIRRYDQEINTVYGYNNITAKSKLSNTLLLNYRFPILFPDAEIGPLAYVRNLRGGIFCHYENIGSETNISEPKTYGFELHTSLNVLRYQPIVDLGTRFVFVNKVYHQNPILELILNYSF
jgi:hypothetical protein